MAARAGQRTSGAKDYETGELHNSLGVGGETVRAKRQICTRSCRLALGVGGETVRAQRQICTRPRLVGNSGSRRR